MGASFSGGSVSSPSETAPATPAVWLVAKLLERPGEIVWREEIAQCVWPGKDVSAGALRAAMIRLRRRVAAVGVRILTVRGRGFILTIDQRGSE